MPVVAQGFVPVMVAVTDGLDLVVVKSTESVENPGNPFLAVAVTVAVFDTVGNSGPKLIGLAERTIWAMLALVELSKVPP